MTKRGRTSAVGTVVAYAVALGALAFAGVAIVGDPRVTRVPAGQTATTTTSGTTGESPARGDVVVEPVDGLRMIALTDTELVSIDAGPNTVRRVDHGLGPTSGAHQPPPLVVSGGHLFLLANGNLRAAPVTLEAPLRDLGGGLVLLASTREGHAWVARERGGGYVLDEIDVAGNVARTSVALPVDADPQAAVGDHVILATPAGLVAWHPSTGAVAWRGPEDAHLVASSTARRWVAWVRGCGTPLCVIHITDLGTGRDRTIPIGEIGLNQWAGGYSADPSGRYIATTTTRNVRDGRLQFAFHLIDLDTGLITEHDAAAAGAVLWSPDGKWAITRSFEGLGTAVVTGFRVDNGELRAAEVNVPDDVRAVSLALA